MAKPMLTTPYHFRFEHPSLEGYFGLYHMPELLRNGEEHKVAHYTVVYTWEVPIPVILDFAPVEIPPYSIFFLTPGQTIVVNEVCKNTLMLEFNRQFYCVELHDEEVSCNGLLFNGVVNAPLIHLHDAERESFAHLIAVMVEEFKQKDNVQQEMLQALLKRFIIKCTRLAREQIQEEKKVHSGEIDLVREFSALVELHFRKEHSVQFYADQLFKSAKTLSNLFNKYSEKSPLKIIQDRLSLEARRLLYYTDKSAKEVAYDLGFEDPAHFSRFFKKSVGVSPTEFKERK